MTFESIQPIVNVPKTMGHSQTNDPRIGNQNISNSVNLIQNPLTTQTNFNSFQQIPNNSSLLVAPQNENSQLHSNKQQQLDDSFKGLLDSLNSAPDQNNLIVQSGDSRLNQQSQILQDFLLDDEVDPNNGAADLSKLVDQNVAQQIRQSAPQEKKKISWNQLFGQPQAQSPVSTQTQSNGSSPNFSLGNLQQLSSNGSYRLMI